MSAATLTAVPPLDPTAPANDTPGLEMPKHFKVKSNKRLREAWADLIESTEKTLHVKQHRFTFEVCATLLAKFRAGDAMTATESKELKKHMVALGLAKGDEDDGPKKPRSNDKYFR